MTEASVTDTTAVEYGETTRPVPVMPRRRRTVRSAVIVVLIVSLLASICARHLAMAIQQQAYEQSPYAAAGSGDNTRTATSLGSLDSYFLVLLLGGLRGPLIMFLWSEVESQKNDKTLSDVDTMIEMIRLLQPEFDSVHIFQAWNKAYNISVQIASLPSRYGIILDAVNYLERVDRGRPNNLNILLSLNQLFQHKLGSTTGDSVYYHRRVREDSKWREVKERSVGALDQRLRPMLDPSGKVLPDLLQPKVPRPADLKTRVAVPPDRLAVIEAAAKQVGVALPASSKSKAGPELVFEVPEADARRLEAAIPSEFDVYFIEAEWNDGSTMQYLPRYAPYPDGLSPLAIGYNYVKRAEVLVNRTKQRPAQGGGPTIIDSRPAAELRAWSDSEWTRALAVEAEAAGKTASSERAERFLVTADLKPGVGLKHSERLTTAIETFRLASQLVRDSRREYYRHSNNDLTESWQTARFAAAMDETRASEQVIHGDLTFAKALAAEGDTRKSLLADARQHYRVGLTLYQFLELLYYVPGEMEKATYPQGLTRANLRSRLDDPQFIADVHKATANLLPQFAAVDQTEQDRVGSTGVRQRIEQRLKVIDDALAGAPATTQATTD